MRILIASKFFYQRGGLERVMFDEIDALERAGHEVVHFSTRHPGNVPSPWAEHFAPYLEIGAGARLGRVDAMRAVLRMFRNRPAAAAIEGLLDASRPDIVHVHGIHRQLSPSILLAAARRSIPVVHTLHDYHLVCPADVMLRGGSAVCSPRACRTYDCTAAIRNRCTRGSLAASTIAAAELSFQRLTRAYERSVTRFISPSRFLGGLMREAGWTDTPIDVVPPGTAPGPSRQDPAETFALFAGRLSPEKGVEVFLSAARSARIDAVVAGDGPLAGSLRASHPEARFTGHLDPAALAGLLGRARMSVLPSVSLENAPLGVLESMAAGVPVVASGVGGVPELVDDGVEGLLVRPGDADALAAAMHRLMHDPDDAERMGRAGRMRVARDFTPGAHLERLVMTYERAVGGTA